MGRFQLRSEALSDPTNLREFITATLLDIAGGVRDAQADPALGDAVNPLIQRQDVKLPGDVLANGGRSYTVVAFDVAVTAANHVSGGGGAKVGVSVFGGSIAGEAGSREEAVSRIRFSVPMVLPDRARS